MGSALATALTQATKIAATQAAKRTRIWRSVARGYLPPPSHVKQRKSAQMNMHWLPGWARGAARWPI